MGNELECQAGAGCGWVSSTKEFHFLPVSLLTQLAAAVPLPSSSACCHDPVTVIHAVLTSALANCSLDATPRLPRTALPSRTQPSLQEAPDKTIALAHHAGGGFEPAACCLALGFSGARLSEETAFSKESSSSASGRNHGHWPFSGRSGARGFSLALPQQKIRLQGKGNASQETSCSAFPCQHFTQTEIQLPQGQLETRCQTHECPAKWCHGGTRQQVPTASY